MSAGGRWFRQPAWLWRPARRHCRP
ncbi:hypothetical protein E6W36_01245 [Hankyongella ginsenosidimutans]|uniref:Uncharacterized protein n=1 Tax=Hankyongella ginsenosidimutans TaxID=1763828 RepID=A0A4D7CCD8_9SPHN|nr:hypothetical protein E6W36_01245 [Hankyongella ginsenosidimutans]